MQYKYIFLDRDGTIIKDNHYNHIAEQIEFLPKATSGLKKLQKIGYQFIMVSNQAGVAKGYYTKKEAKEFQKEVEKQLKKDGIKITKAYFCFHGSHENCNCRKPKPGLALKAAEEFSIKLEECIYVGDKDCDIEFGRNCQGRTILVKNNQYRTTVRPDFEVKNLEEIYQIVMDLKLPYNEK